MAIRGFINDGASDPSDGGGGSAASSSSSGSSSSPSTPTVSTPGAAMASAGSGGAWNEGEIVVTIPAVAVGWPKAFVQGSNMAVPPGGKFRLSCPAPIAGAGAGTEAALNAGIVYVARSFQAALNGPYLARLRPGDVVIFPVGNLNELWFSGTPGDVVYPSIKDE